MKVYQASGLLFNKSYTEVLLHPVGWGWKDCQGLFEPITDVVHKDENCFQAVTRAAGYFGKFFWKQEFVTVRHVPPHIDLENTWFSCNETPDEEWQDLKANLEGSIFSVGQLSDNVRPELVDAIFKITAAHFDPVV